MVRLPRMRRPVALGIVLTLAVLTAAGGLVARRAADAADPTRGNRLSAQDVRILARAASSCTALTPARLAGQIVVTSDPVLTPAQWDQNAPWSGAQPADREAAVTALAHLMCRLVGQARAVRIEEQDPWRVALAAHRQGMDELIKAGSITGDVRTYVDTVERYASLYALQPAFGGGASRALAAADPSAGAVVPVPDPYARTVVAAGRVCAEMPPARVAAQIAVTSGFDPGRVGPAGEQGIAQFLPQVWADHVERAASRSPWDPFVAIPALGRTMCALIKKAGGQYGPALAAFARGDEAAPVGRLAEAVTKAEAEYAKDTRLKPAKGEPAAPERDQPAVKAAGAPDRSYGPYFIVNLATSMCADLPGAGAGRRDGPINQFPCAKVADDNQEWTFEPRAVDPDGHQLYWIRNADDGYCVDPPGSAEVRPGTELAVTGCFDWDNQYFWLEPTTTGKRFASYRLRNAVTGMCLDVPGKGAGRKDARLALAPCRVKEDHDWALVEKPEW